MPVLLLLVVSLTLVLTACGGASPASSTAALKPTSAPPAASPASAAPAAPSPASSPASSPAVSPAASPAAAPPGGARITIAQGSGEARFRAREQLAILPAPNEAIGRTRDVTGTIVLNSSGAVVAAESAVQVDLRTLRSDQSVRDNFIQRTTLQTSRYPTADFAVKEVAGMPWPLPDRGTTEFQLFGDLTVHGVTRPTTWQVSAELTPGQVTATAVADMEISDFGMTPPKAGPVVSIEDDIRIEIDVQASRT